MRLARSTGVAAGIALVILGLWGALIPFVGPYFNYGYSPNASWHFTTNRLWLDILPGAAAALGGILLIASARRGGGVIAGWLALAAGVWFVVGPSFCLLWAHAPAGPLYSGIGTPIGGHDRAAAEAIGFFYAVGALAIAVSAFAITRFMHRAPAQSDTALSYRAPSAPARGGEGEEPPRRERIAREPVTSERV